MEPYVVYILIFFSAVLIVQSVAGLFFSAQDRTKRVNRRLTLHASGLEPEQAYASLMRRNQHDALSTAAPGLYQRVGMYFRQAGLTMSPTRLLLIVAIASAALWLVSAAILTLRGGGNILVNGMVSMFGATGLVVVGAGLWLTRRRMKRLRQVEEQLPLALDIAVRSIRAGHPVLMAIKLASTEMGDPIGTELGLVVDETTYGVELREALVNLARRCQSPYLHFFAITVSIQAETGGNLAEILASLTATIRAQQSLHLRVKALASEGKMSALVLSVIPVAVVCFVMLTNPHFYTDRVNDPLFWPAVAVMAAVYSLGQYIIHRMVNFKY
jgi:tight adherence protein B